MVVLMMQRSGADWASSNTFMSVMWGKKSSKRMLLLLPLFHTDTSVKKLSRLKRRQPEEEIHYQWPYG